MTDLDCNILDKEVTIISTCTVAFVNSNVTVHWYYSQERDCAGVNGSILPGIRQGISVNSECILAQVRVCSAELSITNIRTLHEGYYWCEVDVEESQGLVRRPSSVLRISGCDTLNLCTMRSFRTNIMREFGCALSDTGSDIARTNLTFVDLYSDSCPLGPTTPQRVTTAEEGTKLSTSILGAVLTMTSKLSTNFERTAVHITSATITESSSNSNNSGSSNDSGRVKEISSTSVAGEAATTLPLVIILPVIGGGIGLLLFVFTILLALTLMQRRKKRGRGKPSQTHLVRKQPVLIR